MSESRPRSAAEWVTFAVTATVVAIVVGLLVAQALGRDDPPAPVATIETDSIVRRGEWFHVPVELHNDGHRAAAGVQVVAELTDDGGVESSEQTVDVLGAGETVHLVFVFSADPAAGELRVAVGSFAEP